MEDGIVTAVGDEAQLFDSMELLLTNPDLRINLHNWLIQKFRIIHGIDMYGEKLNIILKSMLV